MASERIINEGNVELQYSTCSFACKVYEAGASFTVRLRSVRDLPLMHPGGFSISHDT